LLRCRNVAAHKNAHNAQGWDSTAFLISDPQFTDSVSFLPADTSPARGHGDPALSNPDGSRSDIGLYGGPAAKR